MSNSGKDIIDSEVLGDCFFRSMEEIDQLEKTQGFSLPEEYKKFLLEFGSGYTKDDYYYKALVPSPGTSEDGHAYVAYFYGSDLMENERIFNEELDRKFLPIADAGFGDLVCIGVAKENYGRIYEWVHDIPGPHDDPFSQNVFLIAESFSDFLNSFALET